MIPRLETVTYQQSEDPDKCSSRKSESQEFSQFWDKLVRIHERAIWQTAAMKPDSTALYYSPDALVENSELHSNQLCH